MALAEGFTTIAGDAGACNVDLPHSLYFPTGEPARVPYAILEGSPEIHVDGSSRRTAVEHYLIKASDAAMFVRACIGLTRPPLIPYANFLVRYKRRMPGYPNLVASGVRFSTFEPRPGDPTGTARTDVTDWKSRYSRYLRASIEYSTEANVEPGLSFGYDSPIEADKPETFTEVKANISGEFVNLGKSNARWVKASTKSFDSARFSYVYTSQGENPWDHTKVRYSPWKDSTGQVRVNAQNMEKVLELSTPITRTIPLIEWTVIWRHVFYVPWQRIKTALGKVNWSPPADVTLPDDPAHGKAAQTMPLFQHAANETVLFIGCSVTEEGLRTPNGDKLWTIEMNFLERSIREFDEDGNLLILGWNHYWRPDATRDSGGRWQRLIVDASGQNKDFADPNQADQSLGIGPYKTHNFLRLFRVQPGLDPGFVQYVERDPIELPNERGVAQPLFVIRH